MANPKLKVGDRIVFGRCNKNKNLNYIDITIGKIYTIIEVHPKEGACFLDDKGEQNYAASSEAAEGKATKIVD